MSFEYDNDSKYVMQDACSRSEGYRLPNIEVFELSAHEIGELANASFANGDADGWVDRDGEFVKPGWYWWTCLPGCMPDSEAAGPFETKELALKDARGES